MTKLNSYKIIILFLMPAIMVQTLVADDIFRPYTSEKNIVEFKMAPLLFNLDSLQSFDTKNGTRTKYFMAPTKDFLVIDENNEDYAQGLDIVYNRFTYMPGPTIWNIAFTDGEFQIDNMFTYNDDNDPLRYFVSVEDICDIESLDSIPIELRDFEAPFTKKGWVKYYDKYGFLTSEGSAIAFEPFAFSYMTDVYKTGIWRYYDRQGNLIRLCRIAYVPSEDTGDILIVEKDITK